MAYMSSGMLYAGKIALASLRWTPNTILAKAVDKAGFEYVYGSDIIKSKMDAWQRHWGYCWAYDIGAPGLFMIIDCEPFYFDYDGKHWMIELWKGQYGLMTGAEIGLYNAEIGGVIGRYNDKLGWLADRVHFFWCATNPERLVMQFKLFRKSGGGEELLFERFPERHWWLTGFKWGEFTDDPSSLSMELKIHGFPNQEMRDSFKASVESKGYQGIETPTPRSIGFRFEGVPKTEQPVTRAIAPGVQKVNEFWVSKFNESKKALGITNNDPNSMIDVAVQGAKLVAEKTAYQIVLDLYEKWARTWHGSTRR